MDHLYTDILQICRTCMKEIIDAPFFYLDCIPSTNTQVTIRQTLYSCIPELDLSIVPNTVMCKKCVDTLLSVFEFKKNCHESEIQINKYIQQVQHTGDLSLVEVVRFHQPDIKNLNIQVKIEDLDTTENFKNEHLVWDTFFNEASESKESFHQPDIKNRNIQVKIEDLDTTENFKNEHLVWDTFFNEASESKESFHQPDIKNLNIQVKIEDLDTTENFKNEHLVWDTFFNEASESKESFHQPDIKNLHSEIKIEDLDLTENFKNEDLVCGTSATGTESTERKYIKQEKGDMQYVVFNTYDDCNTINYNLSVAAENSDTSTHNSSIAQNCLREVIVHEDHNYSKNLNKTNAYYQCYKCGHKAVSKLKLILHLKQHTPSKYKKSKQHLSRRNSLKPNMRAHIVEKLFNCSICEYQCRTKYNLKQHMRLHTEQKPLSCSVCEHQCSQKRDLKQHMLIHTGEKPFSCSVCDYQCSQKSNLKKHILIHTGEKPFSCSFCEYQCSQKSNLKKHILIHTGEKPFSCSVCDYQSSQKSNLKQHIIIHTEEKPFCCSVCEYQCTQKGTLKRHMRIHT